MESVHESEEVAAVPVAVGGIATSTISTWDERGSRASTETSIDPDLSLIVFGSILALFMMIGCAGCVDANCIHINDLFDVSAVMIFGLYALVSWYAAHRVSWNVLYSP